MTRFVSPARSAARPMIPARIVGCSRLPASPQKTGSISAGRRSPRSCRSSSASCEAERLATGLGALAPADEQRRALAAEIQIAPVERDQFRPAQARLETSASKTSRSRSARPWRRRGGCSAATSRRANSSSLNQSASCCGFGGGSSSRNGVRQAAAPAEPVDEAAQEPEAAVVGRRGGPGGPAGKRRGGRRSSTPRRRFRPVAPTPVEQAVDRDPISRQGAFAGADSSANAAANRPAPAATRHRSATRAAGCGATPS